LSRTFLSLPLFFDNDIEGVVNEYAARKAAIPLPVDPGPGATPAELDAYNRGLTAYNQQITLTLSDVFEQKLEAFSFMPDVVGNVLPSANWRLQWNSLGSLPFIKPWAQRASLTHEYRGQYTRNFRETTDGRVPETQTVSRGFQPLIGISITGDPEFWKGTASATLNYNTVSEFALVAAARSEISKQLRNELQLRLGYTRTGLKLSIFGIDLKNEIEFTTDFTMSRQNTKRYNLTDFREEGNNDGSTRISFRPAIRYSVSRTVDATGFVSYEATIPDEEGSRDISRSTLKVGVDLRLKISGGR
jgi:cell surface protein SprA